MNHVMNKIFIYSLPGSVVIGTAVVGVTVVEAVVALVKIIVFVNV